MDSLSSDLTFLSLSITLIHMSFWSLLPCALQSARGATASKERGRHSGAVPATTPGKQICHLVTFWHCLRIRLLLSMLACSVPFWIIDWIVLVPILIRQDWSVLKYRNYIIINTNYLVSSNFIKLKRKPDSLINKLGQKKKKKPVEIRSLQSQFFTMRKKCTTIPQLFCFP